MTSPSRALLSWYQRHRRDLPWRRRPTPYRVWISEVMLQQTRVETVIPYYRRFLARFPSLKSLATADLEEVLPLWSGLGYYRRIRNLHRAARIVVEEHRGRFPRDLQTALELPGIGPYTAAAILSIAYGVAHPVLDGNVERVLCRVLAESDSPAHSAVKRRLRDQAAEWMPPERASDFNQAIMELGALVCTPANPRCGVCPVEAHCEARREGNPTAYPVSAPRRKSERVHLAAVILERSGKYLLERHDVDAPDGPSYLRGLWTFPTHDLTGEEGTPGGLASRLDAAGDGSLELTASLGSVDHAITHRRITLEAWKARGRADLSTRQGRERAWIHPDDLGTRVAIPSLTRKILTLLDLQRSGET